MMTAKTSREWADLISDLEARRDVATRELESIAESRKSIALALVQNDPFAVKTAAALDKRKAATGIELADLEAAITQARAELRKAQDNDKMEARIAKAGALESLAHQHAQRCGGVDKAMRVLAGEINALFATERDLSGAGVATKRITGQLTRALHFAFSEACDGGFEREVRALLGHDRPSPDSWKPLTESARSGKAALSLAQSLRSGIDPETVSGNAA